MTRSAPQVLDRASAHNLIDAFNLATCWDCAIGIDGCYRVHALRVDCIVSGEGSSSAMVVRLHGRVFALGDYSVKHSVRGASRRDVQRKPKHCYFGPRTLDRVWQRFDYPQGFLYSDTPEHWWTAPTPYGKLRLLWLLRLQ